MNGARMRWYSLTGTRPAAISASVPAADRAIKRPHPHFSEAQRLEPFRRGFPPGPARHTRAPRALTSSPATPTPRVGLRTPPPAISCASGRGKDVFRRVGGDGHGSRSGRQFRAGNGRTAGAVCVPGRRHHRGTLALAAYALSAGGFGVLDALLLLLFGAHPALDVIGFWNAVIGFCIMRFARDPIAAVRAGRRAHPRRRADHGIDRDLHLRPQRAAGPRDPQSRRHDARDRSRRRGRSLSSLCAERHQPGRHRGAGRHRLRRARRSSGAAASR